MSAVSAKRNTTRQNIVGVYSDAAARVQVVFYDTPGFVHVDDVAGVAAKLDAGARPATFAPREARVARSVMISARETVRETDLTVFVGATNVYISHLKSSTQL